MSNATATKTKPACTTAEDEPWVMPQPQRGQSVVFHRMGNKNSVTDVLGTVLAVSPVNVELAVHGMVLESVRHSDDPRARQRPELRDPGTWSFCEHDKVLEDRISKLEAQMAELLK